MVSHYYIILYQPLLLTIWLVVNLPSWKIWKSMGRIIPYIMENKKWSKPPTRYIYIYTYYSKYYWNKNNCWKSCSQHAMQMGNPHRRWIGLPFQPTEARMNPIKHGTHTNIDINMNINININITINIKYEYIIYIYTWWDIHNKPSPTVALAGEWLVDQIPATRCEAPSWPVGFSHNAWRNSIWKMSG